MTAPIILVLGALLLIAGVFYVVVARPRINQWGATDQEHQATWPGDHLVTRPSFVWTNAITIEAPAAQIWPWLVQLGQGRGGLSSYDWLENLIGCDVHSTDRILPAFQTPLQVGDRQLPSPSRGEHTAARPCRLLSRPRVRSHRPRWPTDLANRPVQWGPFGTWPGPATQRHSWPENNQQGGTSWPRESPCS